MNIDWKEAPEGATHGSASLAESRWWKKNQGKVYDYVNRKWRERRIHPLDLIPRPTQWTGEGIPPVGTVCEGHTRDSAGSWRWLEVEVLKQNNIPHNECAVHVLKLGVLRWCDEFRPTRTPRERWEEQAFQIIYEKDDYRDAASALYDAIQSGKLPVPEASQ